MRLQEEEHKLGVPAAKVRMAMQDIEGDDRRARLPALVDAGTSEAVQEHDALPATAAQDGEPGAKIVPQQLMLALVCGSSDQIASLGAI